jgi:hypothetical protein
MKKALHLLLVLVSMLLMALPALAAEERHGMLPVAPFSYEGRIAVVIGQPEAVSTPCHPEALLYPVVIIHPGKGRAFVTGLVVDAAAPMDQGSRWDIHEMGSCAHHDASHEHVHVHLIRR